MMRRSILLVLTLAAAVLAVSCQTGVTMWSGCSPAADGNPTGTDGTYVLICKDGTWEPLMTVYEYVRLARGEHVTVAPLPTRPTTTTTTTVAASTVDQSHTSAATASAWVSSSYVMAQTFTAGRTGTLDKVSVRSDCGTTGLSVQIRELGGTNLPDGAVLGSGSLTAPGNPDAESWEDIPLSSPASVQAGTAYAMVLTGPTSTTCNWDTSSATPYADGRAHANVSGGGWGTVFDGGGETDFAFKTWVR